MVNLLQNPKQRACFLLNQIYSHIWAVWTSVSYLLNSETFYFKPKYFKVRPKWRHIPAFSRYCFPNKWLLMCSAGLKVSSSLLSLFSFGRKQTAKPQRDSFPSFRCLKENSFCFLSFRLAVKCSLGSVLLSSWQSHRWACLHLTCSHCKILL